MCDLSAIPLGIITLKIRKKNEFVKLFILIETQVTENISRCIKSASEIPEEELKKYTSYITNIASSKVTV